MVSSPTHVECELPPVDERLVEPETRYEMYDGELVYVPPADPPHAIQHTKVGALVELHARPEFWVATEMLTRTSRTNDVAPDVSVFPRAPDPRTGRRQLEQLAFEVVSTQSLGNAGHKAAKLAARGVRRVFAIDLERARVLEWSGPTESWQPVASGAYIEDPVFAVPLPVEPLVRAATIDDAVARALIAKRNPVLEAEKARSREEGERAGVAKGRQEGLAEGRQEALTKALLEVLAARGLPLDPADQARVLGETDPQRLERWFARAVRCTSIADVFSEP